MLQAFFEELAFADKFPVEGKISVRACRVAVLWWKKRAPAGGF